MRIPALILFTALATAAVTGLAQNSNDLPDIGSPAGALITLNEEYQLGRQIVGTLRDQNAIIEDPETTEYLNALGARLTAHAPEGDRRFTFFPVREETINAFALPGGFIGVNYGTVLASKSESELAGVMAHEIAHVTQRHIARTIRAQGRQSIAQTAAILAAILVGAMAGGSPDAMQGAIAIAQGAAAQQQVNFTRANEYEADRVGIGLLASAGFDPYAMSSFFETMSRRTGLAGSYLPEMILTHPVSANRMAEARSRAEQLDRKREPESTSYALIRERLRVLNAPRDANMVAWYEREKGETVNELGKRYGQALALMGAGKPGEAAKILHELLVNNESQTLLHIALAQAEVQAGQVNDGLSTFQRAMALFPRNVPLTVRYAEALMSAQRPKEAHAVLLDLFNNVPPTPEQIRLTALAASAAGDIGDAYYYMSEYHIVNGDLLLAVQQLELALAAPNLNPVQKGRFEARLKEIRDYLATVKVRRDRSKDGGTR